MADVTESFPCNRDVDFVVYFDCVDTLVLDHNHLHEGSRFPTSYLRLQTLWANFNLISELERFAQSLAKAFPRIRYVSLMGNPAVPGSVRGSTFHDYAAYRSAVADTPVLALCVDFPL